MSLNLEAKVLGPRGGDVTNPARRPEARNADLNIGDTGLHKRQGFRDTSVCGIENEQPWHLMAAYMLLAKRTNSEIALAAGVTPETVSHLRAQKWFQQRCARIANETGDEIAGALAGYALAAVEGIADLAENAESESVRLNAHKTLLEHANGKPLQRVISHSSHSNLDPVEEYDEIQRELRALRGST